MAWDKDLDKISSLLGDLQRDIDFSIAEMQNEIDDARTEGYNTGYDKGYDKGYSDKESEA